MKVVIALAVMVLVLVPTAFATGQALDPRVPGLQRQVRAVKADLAAVHGQLGAKVDKSCVEIVQIVVRPGYVYQGSDGTLFIAEALDTYHPEFGDGTPNNLMQLKAGC